MSDAQGFWQQNCQVPFHGDRLKVGFHNEHHDFPNVAWGNLPKAEGHTDFERLVTCHPAGIRTGRTQPIEDLTS